MAQCLSHGKPTLATVRMLLHYGGALVVDEMWFCYVVTSKCTLVSCEGTLKLLDGIRKKAVRPLYGFFGRENMRYDSNR
jgi:hypothetical protein